MYPSIHAESHWLHPHQVLYTTSLRLLLCLIVDRESSIQPHISGECSDHSAIAYMGPYLSFYLQTEIPSQKRNILGKSRNCANHSLSVLKVMRVRKDPVLLHLSSLCKGFSVVADSPQLQQRQQMLAFFPKHWVLSHGKLLQLKFRCILCILCIFFYLYSYGPHTLHFYYY